MPSESIKKDIIAKRWQRRSHRVQMQEIALAKPKTPRVRRTKAQAPQNQPQQPPEPEPEPQTEPHSDLQKQSQKQSQWKSQWIVREGGGEENVCLSTQASQIEGSQETLIQSPRKASPQFDEMQTQIYRLQSQVEKLTDIVEQEVSARTKLVRKLDGELRRERVRIWALSQN